MSMVGDDQRPAENSATCAMISVFYGPSRVSIAAATSALSRADDRRLRKTPIRYETLGRQYRSEGVAAAIEEHADKDGGCLA